MSKYIIDVGEGYIRHGLERTLAIPVRINDHEDHWMDTRIPVTPYTEPSLDEAYAKGYKEGMQLSIDDAKLKEEYKRGLADAWEAAQKIGCGTAQGGFSPEMMQNIFGTSCFSSNVFHELTASEAIEKIRQYEQEKEEIKVGDEVVSEDDIKAVVIDMDDYLLHVLDENGVVQGWPREDVAKTDHHFPEISAVLEKMREGQE